MKRQGRLAARRPSGRSRPRPPPAAARSASSASRRNSQSSSRKRTPRWASVTSPGRGGLPPPISPAAEIVWWGARKGRAPASGSARRPQALAIRATSSASSRVSGGRIDGSRRAASDLPAPGGPTISRLWPPPRRPRARCAGSAGPAGRRGRGRSPFGSAASGSGSRRRRRPLAGGQRRRSAPGSRPAITSIPLGQRRLGTVRGRDHDRPHAPLAGGLGHRQRAGDRPAPSRRAPARRPAPGRPSRSQRSWPEAASSAAAIARSNPGPALRRLAGARLTVIRRSGNSKPQLTSAARTRSRASRTAASGRPTIEKAGSPRWTSTSTRTGAGGDPVEGEGAGGGEHRRDARSCGVDALRGRRQGIVTFRRAIRARCPA